jgi:hypothetical protein
VHEFVVRNCALKFLQPAPIRGATERAQVRRRVVRQFLIDGADGGRAGEQKKQEAAQQERAKHQFGISDFNTMIVGCSRFFSSATSSANRAAAR